MKSSKRNFVFYWIKEQIFVKNSFPVESRFIALILSLTILL